MKKLLTILSLFFSLGLFGQFNPVIVNRSNGANTVQDARLAALYNFILPRYQDTSTANLSPSIGLDSIAALIYTRSDGKVWVRKGNPKRWSEFGGGSASFIEGYGISIIGDVVAFDYTLRDSLIALMPQRISALLPASQTNTINNANFGQEWQWNTLAGNSVALKLSSNTTAANGVTGLKLFESNITGFNSSPNDSYSFAGSFSNTRNGPGTNAVGIYAHASGASNITNFAAYLDGYTYISGGAEIRLGLVIRNSNNYYSNYGVKASGMGTFINLPFSTTTTNAPVLSIQGNIANPANGFGVQLEYASNNPSFSSEVSMGYTSMVYNDVTGGSQDVDYHIFSKTAGSNTEKLKAYSTGQIQLPYYGDGTISGTAAYVLAVDASGNVIETTLSGGSGTVTSFSAGDLSPLFTTSEATATTTPALSFSLSNAAANTYFGNATSGSTTPSFTAAGALTKTDDTNVTLTLGGNPTTSLLRDVSMTLGWTGSLAATKGGTGTATYTTGDILYASATNTLSKLPAGTEGFVLTIDTGVPTWAAVGSGSTAWSDITNPTGNQFLTFSDAEISTWANQSNTETFLSITSNLLTTGTTLSMTTTTMTSGHVLTISSTSTALSSGNELLNLAMSGANGTSSITATPLRISVSNTGTTSTNAAIDIASSGATNNYAININSGQLIVAGVTTAATPSIAGLGDINTGIEWSSADVMNITLGGVREWGWSGNTYLADASAILGFNTTTSGPFGGAISVGISYNTAGVLEINNGSIGTIRDLRVRSLNPTTGSVGIGNTSPSALLTLGTAGSIAGTLSMAGSTSGTFTLQVAAAAGTVTLTAPTTDGNSGEFLQTNGSGVLTWAVPSGSGTVTSFSAGDLSPIFTTSEATATTTPALSFTLSNAGANTYFGNATGSSAAPSYTSMAALTDVDDTNVTLTLGGTPATSLLKAVSLTLGWTGSLAATRGGTGITTYTTGDILYASATNTLSKLAAGTNGHVLTLSGGVPTWAAVSGGSGSPGGSTTHVQYNSSGSFAGNSVFTYNGDGVGIGSPATSNYPLSVNGSGNGTWIAGPSFITSVSPSVGNNPWLTYIAGSINEAASGTHALIAGLYLDPPSINSGSASVNNTATLYISSAPSATVSGSNYAIWASAGAVRFDGSLSLGTAGGKLSIATGANASVGTATLSSGTVTVNTTAVTSSSLIFVVYNTPSGTLASGLSAPTGSIVNATSFVINSLTTSGTVNTSDNSSIRWWIIN